MSLRVESGIPPVRGKYDAGPMAVVTETLEVEGIRFTLAYDSSDVRAAAVAAIEAAGFSVA